MNDRIRKTLLSNHHSNHSYRQGSSMNVKPNGYKFNEKQKSHYISPQES